MKARHGWYRVWITLGIAAVGLMLLWLAMSRRAEAGIEVRSQTTLDDFNGGEFLRTGLADVGDGAVSLLRAGLSGEWITTVVTAGLTPRWGHTAVYTNGRIYVIGGLDDPAAPNAITATIIQSAAVQSDHNLSPWATVPTNLTAIFPRGTAYGGAVLVNDFLYVIGGRQDLNMENPLQSQVAYARVRPDGTLSPFTATTPLPSGLSNMAVAAWDGWIYVIGGLAQGASITVVDTIYAARPDPATGEISRWALLTWTLPYPLHSHAAVAEQGYLYVIGGMTQTAGSPLFEVWFAPLGAGTLRAPFTRTAALDNNLVELAAIGYNGLLLTSGGLQSTLSDPSPDVRAGVIADSGPVITWTATSLITPPRHAHAMVVLPDGWVYVIGGRGRIGASPIPLTHINAGRLGTEGMGLFVSSGRYLAPPFHLDRRRLLQTLRLHVWRPDSTEIAVRYRVQPQDGFPWGDWGGWLPLTGTGELTVSIPIAAYAQALQYEVALTTTNPLTAPFLLNADLLFEVPDRPPSWIKIATPPGGTAVRPGERLTYTLVLTNDSGATLHGVRLQDDFPAGTSFVEGSVAASPGLSWTVSPSGVVGALDVLGQGQVIRLTFAVTVTAGAGSIENTAYLYTDEFPPDQRSVLHPIAALTGSMDARPPSGGTVFPGDRLTYTVRVTNPALAAIGPVEITGRLPVSITLLPGGIQASAGTVYTNAFPDFRWTLSTVEAGAAAALTMTVRVTDAPFITDGAWLTATAALSGAIPLPLGIVTHEVRQPYIIQVTKTDGKTMADIDALLVYTITLTNTGWVTVTDLRITDTLAGWPWIFFPDQPGASRWVTAWPALGPQATAILTRSARISLSANISDVVAFTNTVIARSFGTSGVPLLESFGASDVTALAGPDLVATIPPDSIQYEEGNPTRTLTFTLQVANVGPGTARPLSGTLQCAPWWVLIGLKINGNPADSRYFSIPARRLAPGESLSQTFVYTTTEAISITRLQAMVDAPAPGFGDPARGCVMEVNEGNNNTLEVWIGQRFRVFLPLVLRSP
ncbi:hypothetical protein HRbin22_00257 [Candidatus Thermoflexus japonica]|uniref:DUF11 domain-containing protein n=1 Tax=Candidatus Thermoflexus japonica TaxID=2035417 RepID=A0A2H5Y3W4_9CHLR|nr:hypothetical protein HRbin22_00257 [Candidatus Thermoflexus japonica]